MLHKIDSLLTLTTSMTGGKRELKARISNIGNKPRVLWAVTALVLVLAVASAVAACTSPQAIPEERGLYVTIECDEPVYSVGWETAGRGGGCQNADNSAFRKGERVQVLDDLASNTEYTVSICGANGEVLGRTGFMYGSSGSTVVDITFTGDAVVNITFTENGEIVSAPEAALSPAAPDETPILTPAPTPVPTPAPVDRSDPTAVAEAFLTAYFDRMCALDNNLSQLMRDGLLEHTNAYHNDIALLSQWIAYKAFLAEGGYDVERDVGRFVALEVFDLDLVSSLAPGVFSVLDGYFKTTAFSTLVQLEMTKDDAGNYAVVNARFPDWKEYNSFCADFRAYMEKIGREDYNKSVYIDHLQKQRNELLTEAGAWKKGERFCEPFSPHRSFIELTYYGARLNSNGAEQMASMAASNVSEDRFVRKATHGAAELWVARTLRGTLGDDIDLILHNMETYDWGGRLLYGTAGYDPQAFFGADTPVTHLYSRSAVSENGKSIFTVYYVQFAYEGEDVVLTFRFHNATNIDDKWQLYQSEDDCEQWMKTLTFAA